MTDVAVLGGGVGGLSAAHELAERGISVVVYERNDRFGGKARSVPGPTPDGGDPLPAEHGFRLFPGFYRHVTETMSRIPYGEGNVAENLVETTRTIQATTDRQWTMSTSTPRTLREYRSVLWSMFGGPDVPPDEKAYFLDRLLYLLTSCERRWREEFDAISWWTFTDAAEMSPGYRKILGRGLPQGLVATRPEQASTRTMGRIYLQLIQGIFDESMAGDRVLNGPTNDVWIDPWTDYLESLGVDLRTGATVRGIDSDGDRITGVRIDEDGDERTVEADYYVAALPVEVMRTLLTPSLERAAPSLGGVEHLRTEWMNGLQFYLERDLSLAHGHGIYFDSPWAITSVSQRQFWTEYDVAGREDGIEGVLSVIVSDWERPGVVYDKPARECSPEEIRTEVLTQLRRHLTPDQRTLLSEDLIREWQLDPALEYDPERGEIRSRESLFVNTVGSLRHRPGAGTAAENLVLAADYVRTETDLATMEAANEAARRAVNAILERSGTNAPRCRIRGLTVPPVLDRLRRLDDLLHRGRLPHPGVVTPALWRTYRSIGPLD